MKRKGFTLIELLAVIVIIAVIALITIPIVINVIENSNKNALVDSAYGIIEAGRLYYVENMDKKEITGRYDFEVKDNKFVLKTDTTKELKFTGKMPKTGMLQIHGDGKEAVGICNDTYCACKSVSELKVTIKEGNCNINGETGEIEETTDSNLNKAYPVGSIYISSTNTDPSVTLGGGTWKLIDKELKQQVISLTPSNSSIEPLNVSLYSGLDNYVGIGNYGTVLLSDHTITIIFAMITDVKLDDNAIQLAKLNLSQLGIASLAYQRLVGVVGSSDAGNSVVQFTFDPTTGILYSDEVVPKGTSTTVAAGKKLDFKFDLSLRGDDMLDSFCNKFYFERIA